MLSILTVMLMLSPGNPALIHSNSSNGFTIESSDAYQTSQGFAFKAAVTSEFDATRDVAICTNQNITDFTSTFLDNQIVTPLISHAQAHCQVLRNGSDKCTTLPETIPEHVVRQWNAKPKINKKYNATANEKFCYAMQDISMIANESIPLTGFFKTSNIAHTKFSIKVGNFSSDRWDVVLDPVINSSFYTIGLNATTGWETDVLRAQSTANVPNWVGSDVITNTLNYTGLLSLIRFNDPVGSTTFYDDARNLNGLLSNTANATVTFGTGVIINTTGCKFGSCVRIGNGSTDRVTTNVSGKSEVGSANNWCVITWFKKEDATAATNGNIMGDYYGGDQGWEVWYPNGGDCGIAGGRICAIWGGGNDDTLLGTTTPNTTFQMIAITYDQSAVCLYQNDTLQQCKTACGTFSCMTNGSGNMGFGDTGGQGAAYGHYDTPTVFKKNCTQADISYYYNNSGGKEFPQFNSSTGAVYQSQVISLQTNISAFTYNLGQRKFGFTTNITISCNGGATNITNATEGSQTSCGVTGDKLIYNIGIGGNTTDSAYLDNLNITFFIVAAAQNITVVLNQVNNTNVTLSLQNFSCNVTSVNTPINLTLLIYNRTGSLIGTSIVNISGNGTVMTNFTFSADATYLWNCLVQDINGFMATAAHNFTINVNASHTDINFTLSPGIPRIAFLPNLTKNNTEQAVPAFNQTDNRSLFISNNNFSLTLIVNMKLNETNAKINISCSPDNNASHRQKLTTVDLNIMNQSPGNTTGVWCWADYGAPNETWKQKFIVSGRV